MVVMVLNIKIATATDTATDTATNTDTDLVLVKTVVWKGGWMEKPFKGLLTTIKRMLL